MHKQGKIREGDYVWVADDDLIYTPGKVIKRFKRGEPGTVEATELGKTYNLTRQETKHLLKADKDIYKDHRNLTSLSQLSEESILFCLRKRFIEDEIYTSIGPILVSINPFKQLPYYTQDVLDAYMDGKLSLSSSPHIYAVAANCYSQMIENGRSQSCVVSGESGAGKTEATKLILQFLTEKSSSGEISIKEKNTKIQQKILEMNPLLEAFGNARTGRNDNSSRFGKLTQLFFSKSKGTIAGVGIEDYLLEKTRIVQQASGERNYHVFYQMLSDVQFAAEFELTYPEKYYYLTQTGNPADVVVTSLNDSRDWKDTIRSMEVLGFSTAESKEVWKILAGILNLGNIQFKSPGEKDPASLKDGANNKWLSHAAKFLGFQDAQLSDALLRTRIQVRTETTFKNHTLQQATDARDALAKSLYGAIFSFLIQKVNSVLSVDHKSESFLTINVLDIFGFEQFETNSFEQLCINYCNEKLQVHFVDNVFKAEQQSYLEEGIKVKDIDFEDNSEVLKIVEDKSLGIFSILNEQNKLPQGSDKMFLKKVLMSTKHFNNLNPPNIKDIGRNNLKSMNFNIIHFAGEVSYNATKFLEKNSDKLLDSIQGIAKSTTNSFVELLFKNFIVSKKKAKTLGSKFKGQLDDLLKLLNASQPHFVRTIKPNSEKVRDVFQSKMVLDQIKCAGLLGICEVHKNGYPIKHSFRDFYRRYNMIVNNTCRDHVTLCSALESRGLLQAGEWQIGSSKVFMRNGVHEELENIREDKLSVYTIIIQKTIRGYLARKAFKQYKLTVNELQNAIRSREERKLQDAVQAVSALPKVGAIVYLVQQARQVLSEIGVAKTAILDLQKAVDARDANLIKSMLITLDSTNLKNISGQSIIPKAQRVLDELKQVSNNTEEYSFKNSNIDKFIEQVWEKMASSYGITKDDVEQVDSLVAQLEDGEFQVDDPDALLQKASTLYEFASLQLEIQEFVRQALINNDPQELEEALQFTQQFNLQTNDAKQVINIMLQREEKAQDNLMTSIKIAPIQSVTALNMSMKRSRKNDSRMPMTSLSFLASSQKTRNLPPTNQVFSESIKGREMFNKGGQGRFSAVMNMSQRMNSSRMKPSAMMNSTRIGSSKLMQNVSARLDRAQLNASMMTSMGPQSGQYDVDKFYQLRPVDNFYNGAGSIPTGYTGVPLEKSLTVLNEELNKIAVQVNKSILQYTGDENSQYPSSAAQKVIQLGIQFPILSNEIYLQILKNVRNNTRPTSEDRSWILLILVTQLFPPTRELQPYLTSFLKEFTSVALIIGNYAKLCLAQLDRTLELGPSDTVPDVDLINAYSARPALLLTISTCIPDYNAKKGEPKLVLFDIPCYPDTEVETIVSTACEIAGFSKNDIPFYGLFVTSKKVKVQNKLAGRLERFYQAWDPSKLKHVDYFAAMYQNKERELFAQLVKKYGPEPKSQNAPRSTVRSTMRREDVDDENLFYPIPWWTFPGDIFMKLSFKGREPQFSLKRKIILGSEKPCAELVEQSREQIARGELAIVDYEEIICLAAVSFTLRNNGPVSSLTEVLSFGLDYFFPQIWLREQAPKKTAGDVCKLSSKYAKYRPKDLHKEFLDICKEAEGFGVWFFPASEVISFSPSLGQVKNHVDYVGVSAKGVHIFDVTRTETLQLFPYASIVEYSADNDRISFNFRTSSGETGPQAEFLTEMPWEIYFAIQGYIDVLSKLEAGKLEPPRTNFDRGSVFRTGAY